MSESKNKPAQSKEEYLTKENLYKIYLDIKSQLSDKPIEIDKEEYEETIATSTVEQLNGYIIDGIEILVNTKIKEALSKYEEEQKKKLEKSKEITQFDIYENMLKKLESKNRKLMKYHFQARLQKEALELKIAENLARLLNAPNNCVYDGWRDRVKALEEKQGFDFDEDQIRGIEIGLNSQVCLISGLAGAGKSSLVSGILAALGASNSIAGHYTFAQCALSGKASARLQEVTGEEGKTIHRLLEYSMGEFKRNKDNILKIALPHLIITYIISKFRSI